MDIGEEQETIYVEPLEDPFDPPVPHEPIHVPEQEPVEVPA